MRAKLTTKVLARGYSNAGICLLGILAVGLPIFVLIWATTAYGPPDSAFLAMGALSVPTFVVGIAYWIRDQLEYSPVLLDAGPNPSRRLLAFGVFGPLLGSFGVWGSGMAHPLPVYLAYGCIGVSFAFFALLMAVGRLQFQEAGIWAYCGRIPWSRIGEWHMDERAIFFTSARRRLGFHSKGAIPIPPEQREQILEIMRAHCRDQERTQASVACA